MTAAEDAFLDSGRRTIAGMLATLAKNDFATLKAMGAQFFNTELVPDLGQDWPGRERDLMLVGWLSTRSPKEKEAAFVDPKKAAGEAFRWANAEDYDGAEVYGALIRMLSDISNAKTRTVGEKGGDSELPP